MLRTLLAALVSFWLICSAQAQKAVAVTACGSDSLDIGQAHGLYMDSTGVLCIIASGPTYSAGAAAYIGYASPTDFFSIAGSATKTIKIINIRLSGYATANNNVPVALLKRSTANTGGTPTAVTKTPWDSANPAATATIATYGAAPTLGTLVGALCACQVELPATSGVGGSIVQWNFNHLGGSPLILRGANEMVTLNAYGTTFPAGTNLNITIEWMEH